MKKRFHIAAFGLVVLTTSTHLQAGAQIATGETITASPKLPRGMRNNNPLNIEAGKYTQSQHGYVGSDGRFAKFETMDDGIAAADRLLRYYGSKYGINTIEGVVQRWAPPVENDSSAYANTVASKLRLKPRDVIDLADQDLRLRLILAMAEIENGMRLRPR